MLVRLAAVPKQSFPEMRKTKVGKLGTVQTGGAAQQWRFSNIKIATDIFVTIKFGNSKVTVDESWFLFDVTSDCLILHQLGFFDDMALKMIFSGRKKPGLPASQRKTWLVDKSVWQS